MTERQWTLIANFSGEQTCAILSEVMGEIFVNCDFESVECGGGGYSLNVAHKYSKNRVHPHTVKQMLTRAIQSHEVIAITQRVLRREGVLE